MHIYMHPAMKGRGLLCIIYMHPAPRGLIASKVGFLVCSMAQIFYIYMFQAVRRAVNVLNVSTCLQISAQCDIPQCKYKHANVTDSMNWHNNVELPM